MDFADLHFHTTHSDGKHSVNWVAATLERARAQGLSFAVLTDHDGVGGFQEFSNAVKNWWTPLCASELSCTFLDQARNKERELHLLVYGLNPEDPELQQRFSRFRTERENRFFKICEKLREAGHEIDGKAFAKKHPGVLGRPHIADALIVAGLAANRSEAFDKFLKDGGRFDVKKWRFPLEDAVLYAKKSGAKTSVAHPGQYGFREHELKTFKDIGVDAIEVYHPRHTEGERAYYLEAANRYGFSVSGGSDFHSEESDLVGAEPSLGRTQYPYEVAKKFLGDLL